MNEVFAWRDAPSAEFAVIGFPISHSLSPAMHSAAFAACGLTSSYVAIEVHPGEVSDALNHLADLGYRGVNVTVPHKEDAFGWCTTTTSVASDLRVCNTLELQKRHGTNTDVQGFASSLPINGTTTKSALVLGAGGSARSILYALISEGWTISLWNRTRLRAEELLAQIEVLGQSVTIVDEPDLSGKVLIVNTTSASLTGDRLPLDWDLASPSALAYDLAYGKGLTPFLEDAQQFGLEIMDGRHMLMEQGAAAFEFWWNQPAPRKEMLAAIQ